MEKRQSLSQNGVNKIAKMQNLSQNELEQIAKMGRIKIYERMKNERLIIALLKSKNSLAELFNNNLDNDQISEIKKILNKLRDATTKKYRKEIKKTFAK